MLTGLFFLSFPLEGFTGLGSAHYAWADKILVLLVALLVLLLMHCYASVFKLLIGLCFLSWTAFHGGWYFELTFLCCCTKDWILYSCWWFLFCPCLWFVVLGFFSLYSFFGCQNPLFRRVWLPSFLTMLLFNKSLWLDAVMFFALCW